MSSESVVDQLLESACPSIKYRICSEVLQQPKGCAVMAELHDQILCDPEVQTIFSWQQPDGWLGWHFHGEVGTETGIRILCEKGVDCQTPRLARALQALADHPERLERGIGKSVKAMDDMGLGGGQMIRATVFAYAGQEDHSFVQEQVNEALAGFEAVLEVESIKDISEKFRDRLVFLPGVRWPSIYHLRLLAFTRNWRILENQAMLAKAVQRLIRLSPIPSIYIRYKSQWIAPASFCMHDFNPDFETMDDVLWIMWFHRSECLARLGVIPAVPELRRQVEKLTALLEAGDGWFTRKVTHPYFNKWGAYSGLRLEPDWRHPSNRLRDLTFRSILINRSFERNSNVH